MSADKAKREAQRRMQVRLMASSELLLSGFCFLFCPCRSEDMQEVVSVSQSVFSGEAGED